jgi:carbonic anhydrase
MRAQTKESQDATTPQMALQYLKEGNKRFLSNLKVNRDLLAQVNETSDGQFPFAAILSCSDSRTSTELVFDQGLGDIFSVRLAGNIASQYAIGSLEFSCKYLGSKIIVVLGHTHCGAVKGACDDFEDGNITELLSEIKPIVKKNKTGLGDESSKNPDFVTKITHHNIQYQIDKILMKSPMLSDMKDDGKIDIVGALYDISSGEVTFL